MSLKKRIPAGLVDSAFASIATFGAGIYAVRYLTPSELGVYSLFFSAFLLAAVIPASFIFISARVELIAIQPEQRLRAYPQTLSIGGVTSLLSALAVGVAIPTALTVGHSGLVLPMTLTAYVAALLSPLQDHIRGLLHLGNASWGAATVSIVQAAVVCGAILVAYVANVDVAWVPFGSLAVANACSLAVGIAICQIAGGERPDRIVTFRTVASAGGWLLAMNLLTRAADFAGRYAVISVTAADVLGVAEGARIASRPIGVFVMGISAVIIPRSMEIGKHGDRATGRRLSVASNLGIVLIALAYLLVGGFSWRFNVVEWLAPIGYTVPGLVPLTIVGTALLGMLFAERAQLIGAGRERGLTVTELAAAIAFALAGFLAFLIGPFAIPVGMVLMALVRWIGYKSILQDESSPTPTEAR